MKVKKHIFVGNYKTYFVRLQGYFNSILFLIILSFFTKIQSQTLSTSSYSHYGFGEKFVDNDVLIKSMGGVSTAYEIPFGSGINFSNAAANGKINRSIFSLEGTSFWTIYYDCKARLQENPAVRNSQPMHFSIQIYSTLIP